MGIPPSAPAGEFCRAAVSKRAAGNVHDILPPTAKQFEERSSIIQLKTTDKDSNQPK